MHYIELLADAGEVDTCYNDSLHYIGIYFQLLSIVPAASNLPFMDSKYKFTKYFTLLRKRTEHFSMYSEMSNYCQKLADGLTVILNSAIVTTMLIIITHCFTNTMTIVQLGSVIA